MDMKSSLRVFLAVGIAAAVLGCSFEYIPAAGAEPTVRIEAGPAATGAAARPEEEPLFIPSPTPLPATATFTAGPPTRVPMDTATPTLIVPMLMAPDDNLYCRMGPGANWEIDGILPRGTWTGIHGKDASGEWYKIAHPIIYERYCYVLAAAVQTSGNLKKLPVVENPQMLVKKLNVELMPPKDTIHCASFPYTFEVKVEVTTTGPGEVRFQRSFDNENAEPTETLEVTESGRHVFKYDYTVLTTGSHWVLIELYAPNYRYSKDYAYLYCTQ